jgi:hypothetical protein
MVAGGHHLDVVNLREPAGQRVWLYHPATTAKGDIVINETGHASTADDAYFELHVWCFLSFILYRRAAQGGVGPESIQNSASFRGEGTHWYDSMPAEDDVIPGS